MEDSTTNPKEKVRSKTVSNIRNLPTFPKNDKNVTQSTSQPIVSSFSYTMSPPRPKRDPPRLNNAPEKEVVVLSKTKGRSQTVTERPPIPLNPPTQTNNQLQAPVRQRRPSSALPLPIIALKDFITENEEELPFRLGDKMLLKEIDQSPQPWGYGCHVFDNMSSEGKHGWFPLTHVKSEDPTFSLDVYIKKDQQRVEKESIVSHKSETKEALEKKIFGRPTEQSLRDSHILTSAKSAPSLQAAQQNLEKSKKTDFLSSFFRKKKSDGVLPVVEISKKDLTFGDSLLEVGSGNFTDQFIIKNMSDKKLKWGIQFEDYNQPFSLIFFPSSGTLTKGKTQIIKATLAIKTLSTVDVPIYVTHKGKRLTVGPSTSTSTTEFSNKTGFITAKIHCKRGVFGVNPDELDLAVDSQYGYKVPEVLITLKNSLLKNGAFKKEGIFRISGDQKNMSVLKKLIDDKSFNDHPDVYSVATLLKIWFRELPVPLLQGVHKDSLQNDDGDANLKTLESISEPNRTLMKWLLKLLLECNRHCSENKMTLENLAIVVSPNLFRIGKDVDPVDGLIISQKSSKFFMSLLSAFDQKFPSKRKENESSNQDSALLRKMDPAPSGRRRSYSLNQIVLEEKPTPSNTGLNANIPARPPKPTAPKPIVKPPNYATAKKKDFQQLTSKFGSAPSSPSKNGTKEV